MCTFRFSEEKKEHHVCIDSPTTAEQFSTNPETHDKISVRLGGRPIRTLQYTTVRSAPGMFNDKTKLSNN